MKFIEVEVKINVEIPDDATHFYGAIQDEPTWIKCKIINSFE